MVEAAPAEIGMIVRDSFAGMDKNRSGCIEPDEMPVGGFGNVVGDGHVEIIICTRDEDRNLKPAGDVRRVRVEQAQAESLALGDRNEEVRVDFVEHRRWQAPIMAQRGFPREWKDDINRSITQ